jgi:16S rRNA (uracil1498-N3)-methyltransferase
MDDFSSAKESLMRRFFVGRENISGAQATITGPELDHMVKVMRLGPGDPVRLFDDQGWEHEGVLKSRDGRRGEVTILSSYRPERESALRITLAQALGKGDKMDFIVEKAVELGVSGIVPFVSGHTVPRLSGEKAIRRKTRWQKIALSASKQCGRTRVPEIQDLTSFTDLVRDPPAGDLRVVLWEGEASCGIGQLKTERDQVASLILVIGPEGGFTDQEILLATQHGFRSVHLGKRILRTETAALAALATAQLLWGDLGVR